MLGCWLVSAPPRGPLGSGISATVLADLWNGVCIPDLLPRQHGTYTVTVPVLIPVAILAKAAGTTAEAIRSYERMGLISPAGRSPAHHRAYGPEHVRQVIFIQRGLELGFSFAQLRRLLTLATKPNSDCNAVDQIARECRAEVDGKIADLKRVADELDRLICRGRHSRVDECAIVQALCSPR